MEKLKHLRPDELEYLSDNIRCKICKHLDVFHITDEDNGLLWCAVPGCECDKAKTTDFDENK